MRNLLEVMERFPLGQGELKKGDDGTVIAPDGMRLRIVGKREYNAEGLVSGKEPECDWFLTMYRPEDFTPVVYYYNEVK